jgi:hypothetical protein
MSLGSDSGGCVGCYGRGRCECSVNCILDEGDVFRDRLQGVQLSLNSLAPTVILGFSLLS